jgi:hypothetical protein
MTHTGLHSQDHVTAAKKPRNRSTRRCVQCLRQAGTERWFAEDPTFDSDFRQRSKPLTLLRPPASWMTVSIRQRVRWPSWGASIGFRGTASATPGIYSPPTGWRCALPGSPSIVVSTCRSNKSSGYSSIFRSSTPGTLRMRIARFASATRYSMLKRLDMPTFTRTSSPRASDGFRTEILVLAAT